MLHAAVGRRLGLSPTDHKYLDLISREGPLTAGRLAQLTGLTTGAVTALVDRLEGTGFVRRRRDPADRRAVLVEADESRLADIGILMAGLGRRIAPTLDGYTAAQLTVVSSFLEHLVDAVAQTREEIERRDT